MKYVDCALKLFPPPHELTLIFGDHGSYLRSCPKATKASSGLGICLACWICDTMIYLDLLAQISSKMPQMFVHGDFSFQCSDFFQGAQYISLFSVLISSKMPKPFVHRYLSIQCSDFFQDAQYIYLFSVLISSKIPIILPIIELCTEKL